MRKPIALSIVPALLLSIGACSADLPHAVDDACAAVNAWFTGGRRPAEFDRFVTRAQDALADSENDALIATITNLAAVADADRAATAEDFITQCSELGWEPPEG